MNAVISIFGEIQANTESYRFELINEDGEAQWSAAEGHDALCALETAWEYVVKATGDKSWTVTECILAPKSMDEQDEREDV